MYLHFHTPVINYCIVIVFPRAISAGSLSCVEDGAMLPAYFPILMRLSRDWEHKKIKDILLNTEGNIFILKFSINYIIFR